MNFKITEKESGMATNLEGHISILIKYPTCRLKDLVHVFRTQLLEIRDGRTEFIPHLVFSLTKPVENVIREDPSVDRRTRLGYILLE
jgi:hypothetical protein